MNDEKLSEILLGKLDDIGGRLIQLETRVNDFLESFDSSCEQRCGELCRRLSRVEQSFFGNGEIRSYREEVALLKRDVNELHRLRSNTDKKIVAHWLAIWGAIVTAFVVSFVEYFKK